MCGCATAHRPSPHSVADHKRLSLDYRSRLPGRFSRSALDEHLEAFAQDLHGRLLAVRPDGHFDGVGQLHP